MPPAYPDSQHSAEGRRLRVKRGHAETAVVVGAEWDQARTWRCFACLPFMVAAHRLLAIA